MKFKIRRHDLKLYAILLLTFVVMLGITGCWPYPIG